MQPGLVVSAALLPARQRLQPEQRLMLAVLEEAVQTLQRCAGDRDARMRRLFAEVDDWFESNDTEWPFAFVSLCSALGLDPDYIRRGLAPWRSG